MHTFLVTRFFYEKRSRKMNPNERAAIGLNRLTLLEQLDVDNVAIYLSTHEIILKDQLDTLQSKTKTSERRLFLIDLIQTLHNSWEHFCAALEHCKQKHLRQLLENSKSKLLNSLMLNTI